MKVYTLSFILRSDASLSCGFIRAVSRVTSSSFPYSSSSSNLSEVLPYSFKSISNGRGQQFLDSTSESQLQILISGIRNGSSEDEILNSLSKNQSLCDIHLSTSLINKFLHRFEHGWKFGLGIFNWAAKQSGYEHNSETYDKMVDILGKAKQIERMWSFLREAQYQHLISLKTMAKA
ncbi:hypothetical protein Sjap_016413 [Stephania japonica]|uniref:Pentatricopeptide repeat-containing protein n=1 Tax=Stephania japonica TaxID=461633 RepID=A0AAP0IML0_9MAGN